MSRLRRIVLRKHANWCDMWKYAFSERFCHEPMPRRALLSVGMPWNDMRSFHRLQEKPTRWLLDTMPSGTCDRKLVTKEPFALCYPEEYVTDTYEQWQKDPFNLVRDECTDTARGQKVGCR